MTLHTVAYGNFLKVRERGPGKIVFLCAHNKNGSTNYFLLLFDQVAQPVNGNVCTFAPIPLSPPNAGGQFLGFTCDYEFLNGIWVMGSTTAPTLTTTAANDLWIDAKLG